MSKKPTDTGAQKTQRRKSVIDFLAKTQQQTFGTDDSGFDVFELMYDRGECQMEGSCEHLPKKLPQPPAELLSDIIVEGNVCFVVEMSNILDIWQLSLAQGNGTLFVQETQGYFTQFEG